MATISLSGHAGPQAPLCGTYQLESAISENGSSRHVFFVKRLEIPGEAHYIYQSDDGRWCVANTAADMEQGRYHHRPATLLYPVPALHYQLLPNLLAHDTALQILHPKRQVGGATLHRVRGPVPVLW